MATLQIAKVTRYFHNQTDFMAKELFDTLSWTDIGSKGTAALNFIDDDRGELKITSDTHTFVEPFSYIYRYKDNHNVTYSYWYATDIKMRGQDFVILSVTKNWWLTAFVQNPRIYKNLIQTEITWIRSPFFKTWMLDVEDPLMKGVVSGSTRRTTICSYNYWNLNEALLPNSHNFSKIHWYFRKSDRNSEERWFASTLNNYAVFVIPATAYGPMGRDNKLWVLKNDGTATKFTMRNFGQELVFLVPYTNPYLPESWSDEWEAQRLSIGYSSAGDNYYQFERRTTNIQMFDNLLKDAEWGKYFKGFFTGPPATSFTYWGLFRYGPANTNVISANPIGYVGYYFPLRENTALNAMLPDITRGARIGGQQLPEPIIVRYFNDPQPNVYILNYLDAIMNGAKVRYGSLIAGARKASGRNAYMSDGYENKNNYTTSGIQTMRLLLAWNQRFIMSKRTNYTSIAPLPDNINGYAYFNEWPIIYFPFQQPSASDDYDKWLAANRSQMQTAANQAALNTSIGVLTALVAGAGLLAAPVTGGTSLALTGTAIGGATTALSGIHKQEQINAQYQDARNSLGSTYNNVVDEGLLWLIREAQYYSSQPLQGGWLSILFRYSDTWLLDTYEPIATNFTKLNNVIFFNGFYGAVSSAISYKPANMHCCFFQANDEGLFNKISDAIFKNDGSNNPAHEFIKPAYIQALTNAFNNGMRLWYSNPSRIHIDLATGLEGSSEIMYHPEEAKQPMPNYAIGSVLMATHNDIRDELEANEQSSNQ